jgi:isopenicillin N synthase-like dioxygenase
MRRVPELNLRQYTDGTPDARQAFSRALMMGLQDYGFVVLSGHDIPVSLLDAAYTQAEALFARPREWKMGHAGGMRGYTPFGTEHAKNTSVADLKEFWQVGPDVRPPGEDGAVFPDNIWPDDTPGFNAVYRDLFARLATTGRKVLEALTPELDLPRWWFADKVDQGPSLLRILHYPPIPPDADSRAVRSAAHEDINFLTLMPAAKGAGLELLDRDGKWLPIIADPETLIVDSGDMLARLTNDVIPATTHRVVNPTGPNVSRYSMPFFFHPNNSMPLACLPSCVGKGKRYPDITAGEFLAERLRQIGLTK